MGGVSLAIMRLWHGRVAIEKADDDEKFLVERAVPDYGSVGGLLKRYFQRRDGDGIAHFFLVTIWNSLGSVKKFAGPESEIAKYYPENDDFLLEKEKIPSCTKSFTRNEPDPVKIEIRETRAIPKDQLLEIYKLNK